MAQQIECDFIEFESFNSQYIRPCVCVKSNEDFRPLIAPRIKFGWASLRYREMKARFDETANLGVQLRRNACRMPSFFRQTRSALSSTPMQCEGLRQVRRRYWSE